MIAVYGQRTGTCSRLVFVFNRWLVHQPRVGVQTSSATRKGHTEVFAMHVPVKLVTAISCELRVTFRLIAVCTKPSNCHGKVTLCSFVGKYSTLQIRKGLKG